MTNYEEYQDEMMLTQEVLKNDETKLEADSQKLVLNYLSPFIMEGIDTITDDGYPLYLGDVEDEMTDYMISQITPDVFLKLAIASSFENDECKKTVMEQLKEKLIEHYQGYAPVPKRTLSEYVQYADSTRTRDNFHKCYLDYVKALDEVIDYCSDFLEKLATCLQTEQVQHKTNSLLSFIDQLKAMKSEEYYRSITYGANIPSNKLFYQDFYLSEDADDIIQKVIDKPIDFSALSERLSFDYSLEDIYQAIPKDIVSFELLENDELDPNSLNHNVDFIQSFYYLAILFHSNDSDENIEQKINEFLIQKVNSFQDEMEIFYLNDQDNDMEYVYTKRNQ